MKDVWFDTKHAVERLAFEDVEMFDYAIGVTDCRAWCSVRGIRDLITLTQSRTHIDLERWIVTVPERIRDTVATIAIDEFDSSVAGRPSHVGVLDDYARALCAALWRHYNKRPLRG